MNVASTSTRSWGGVRGAYIQLMTPQSAVQERRNNHPTGNHRIGNEVASNDDYLPCLYVLLLLPSPPSRPPPRIDLVPSVRTRAESTKHAMGVEIERNHGNVGCAWIAMRTIKNNGLMFLTMTISPTKQPAPERGRSRAPDKSKIDAPPALLLDAIPPLHLLPILLRAFAQSLPQFLHLGTYPRFPQYVLQFIHGILPILHLRPIFLTRHYEVSLVIDTIRFVDLQSSYHLVWRRENAIRRAC
jgi:hypothetical protein